MNKKSIRGYLMITMAGALWGTIGLLVKTISSYHLSSYDIAFIRLFFAFLMLFTYLAITNYQLLKIDKKGLIFTAIIGFICQAFFNICYLSAIEKTTITTAVILLYTAPVFTIILSKFIYKESITSFKIVSIILCVVGCFLTATGGNLNTLELNNIGVLFGIGAGFTYGLMPVLNKAILNKYNRWTILFYSFGFGSFFLIPFTNPLEILKIDQSIQFWVSISFLGMFPAFLSYAFYLKGLSLGIEPSKASIISTIEVVVAVIIAYFVFNEYISVLKLIGVFMVISSVIIIQSNEFSTFRINKKASNKITI